MKTNTHALSAFASQLSLQAVPAPVMLQLNRILADTLAAVVAGSAEPELRQMAKHLTWGEGPCTMLGLAQGASPDVAALVNGTAGTFLEMDEGNRFSRGHPAVHVIPAVLAVCQQRQLGVDAFLAGVLAGYEVGSRIGAASRLRASMHPHGTWGTVGAAAGCARAVGVDAAGMHEVINIASSLTTATSKNTMLQGGLVRNVYAGLSNRNGLLALQLLESGFGGETHGLESVFGSVVSDSFDPSELLRGLGSEWHVMQNYFKLHSCCRYNHGTLDALDLLCARSDFPALGHIEHIAVHSYNLAAELNDPSPRNTLAAKFSIPFAVATRLVHGHSRLSSFTWDAVRDPRVLALAQKVSVTEDPGMTQRTPQERPARVALHLANGESLVAEVGINRGDDASPYTDAELQGKFADLCTRVWPAVQVDKLLHSTLGLSLQTTQAEWQDWLVSLALPAGH